MVSSPEFVEANRLQLQALMERAHMLGDPRVGHIAIDASCRIDLIDDSMHVSFPDTDPHDTFPLPKKAALATLLQAAEQADPGEYGIEQSPRLLEDMAVITNTARRWDVAEDPYENAQAEDFMRAGHATGYTIIATDGSRTDFVEYASVEGRTNNGLLFAAGSLSVVKAFDDATEHATIERFVVGDPADNLDSLFVNSLRSAAYEGTPAGNMFDSIFIPASLQYQLADALTYHDQATRNAKLAEIRNNPMLPTAYERAVDDLIMSGLEVEQSDEPGMDPVSISEINALLDTIQPLTA